MHIYYVKARFMLNGSNQSKAGYVLAEKLSEALSFAAAKIRTYGKVDITFMECDLRNEQLQVEERAAKQPADHWDKLISLG
jgi:pyrimidine operon attenuation protein/uracil phosphoribosyltransferase